ncbi:zincin-like metallopeptidase domain-containing protein [Siphonobacter sp. SORGH_AS_0500]|uniref:ArdC family protein n=1 Tax=Siphonobacter sp. SORGH_AS_0500 TaxID=1864824 RepID=UPI00285F4943|nr:zincin-like metallopeptidase domain-containing protein [Siphonobacter sp. SORGH_AS_0500]MDR6193337.1 antirestriction protein ArdC [Siphonobacter sp. SORGH_AS_0500]
MTRSSPSVSSHHASDASPPTNDLYARITGKIMADLEQGQLTWRKPWNAEHLNGHIRRPLRWNQEPYTGINTLLLWSTAAEKGYVSPYWMTFKQALELKANVRKGEKGSLVVYANTITREEEDASGDITTRSIPFLKSYTVFNAQQIEGLAEHFYATPPLKETSTVTRNETLDRFFAETKADIYTGTQASYSITTDRVQMPPLESFESTESYYAVLAHEITHWTRHPSRLNRDLGRKSYGDAGYAKEELVAELGACFLAADLGFEPMPENQHAAYIQSWLDVLKQDKRFIIQAACYAEKAVKYLHTPQVKSFE